MDGNWLRVLAATGLVTLIATSDPLQTQVRRTPPLILESIAGGDSFEFYCASCHGKTGKGDGPTAPALKTRPTDLASLARRNGGAFPKDRVLAVVTGTGRPIAAHGSTDMPVWGQIFRWLDSSNPGSNSASKTSWRTSRPCKDLPPLRAGWGPGCSGRIAPHATEQTRAVTARWPSSFAECRRT